MGLRGREVWDGLGCVRCESLGVWRFGVGQSRGMRIQSNGKLRQWRTLGLEGIAVRGHEVRGFRGTRSGDEVVRGHRS